MGLLSDWFKPPKRRTSLWDATVEKLQELSPDRMGQWRSARYSLVQLYVFHPTMVQYRKHLETVTDYLKADQSVLGMVQLTRFQEVSLWAWLQNPDKTYIDELQEGPIFLHAVHEYLITVQGIQEKTPKTPTEEINLLRLALHIENVCHLIHQLREL